MNYEIYKNNEPSYNNLDYNLIDELQILNNIEVEISENTNENTNKNITYNDETLEYSYHNYTIDTNKPSVYKEIIRFININGIIDCFQMKLKELQPDIYDLNELFKNNSCKLIELINRWCWHQYNNPTSMDNVIPYVENNNYDYERFIDDLNYILNVHGTEKAIKITDKIIIDLKKIISDYLDIQYNDFSSRKDQNIIVIRDYIDKKIRLLCTYKKNTYQVIIHSKVYNRLKLKLIMFGKKYNIMPGLFQ